MQKTLGCTQKAAIDGNSKELFDIFGLFYDVKPISFDIITTSRGDTDFRKSILYLLNFYPLKGDKNAKILGYMRKASMNFYMVR